MKNLLVVVLVALFSLTLALSAQAGAFSPTPGGRSTGTQFGGDQSDGSLLPSDLWGYCDLHKGERLKLNFGTEVIVPRFSVEDAFGHKQTSRGIYHPLPWATVAWRVSGALAIGLNVDNPFRLGSAYKANAYQWGFDTQSLVGLTTASFLADIKLTKKLHLSFGPVVGVTQVIYNAAFDLDRAPLPIFTETKAMGIGYGGTASLFWSPNDRTKLGLQYVSPIAPDTWGHTKIHVLGFTIKDRIELRDIVFPQTVTVAGSYQLTKRVQVVGDAYWANYNNTPRAFELKFRNLGIFHPLPTEFVDVFGIHAGANYQINEDWMVRGGVGWLSQGVPDKRLDTLTQDVAGWDLAAGLSYKGLNFGWTHAFGQSDAGSGLLYRKYGITIDTFSFGGTLNWRPRPNNNRG
jgi:hypothetical protein